MASKRKLKKDINYLTFELIAECYTYQYFHKDIESSQIDAVAEKIIENRNELIGRINHIDGKDNQKLVKEYFRKVRKDFNKSVDALDVLNK